MDAGRSRCSRSPTTGSGLPGERLRMTGPNRRACMRADRYFLAKSFCDQEPRSSWLTARLQLLNLRTCEGVSDAGPLRRRDPDCGRRRKAAAPVHNPGKEPARERLDRECYRDLGLAQAASVRNCDAVVRPSGLSRGRISFVASRFHFSPCLKSPLKADAVHPTFQTRGCQFRYR
jgi:hypothetical protein